MKEFNLKVAKQRLLSEVKVNKPAIGQIRSKDLFIQKNGGNLKAFKFNSVDDVDNELQRIYDDYGYDNKPFSFYGGPGEEFEDIYGINPLLLKDFFKYNSKFIDEIKINKPGGSRVYIGMNDEELFKIKNFPSIPNIDGISYEEREKYPKLWEIIEKINVYTSDRNIQDIKFLGDFSSSNSEVYLYVDGESNYTIVDSLKQFSEEYQTEEAWGAYYWKEI